MNHDMKEKEDAGLNKGLDFTSTSMYMTKDDAAATKIRHYDYMNDVDDSGCCYTKDLEVVPLNDIELAQQQKRRLNTDLAKSQHQNFIHSMCDSNNSYTKELEVVPLNDIDLSWRLKNHFNTAP